MMETTIPALSRPEEPRPPGARPAEFRRGRRNVRAGSTSRSPAGAMEPPVGEDLSVRVLVVFECGYRSYREAIAGVVRELRPQAEVSVAEPASLRAEVTRVSPHLVISSQPNTLDSARTTAWVQVPHEPGLAGEICLGGQRREAYDVDLWDLLAIFDEVENLIHA